MWVQQLNKLGLISMNKQGAMENVADTMTKHVPRGVLDKLAGMMGYSFLVKKLQSFRSTRALRRVIGTKNLQRWKNCRSLMMETEELEHDVRSFVDKTTHLMTAVLRRGVVMSML